MKKFEKADDNQTEKLWPKIYKILEILGHPEALVTDESKIWDFTCFEPEKVKEISEKIGFEVKKEKDVPVETIREEQNPEFEEEVKVEEEIKEVKKNKKDMINYLVKELKPGEKLSRPFSFQILHLKLRKEKWLILSIRLNGLRSVPPIMNQLKRKLQLKNFLQKKELSP